MKIIASNGNEIVDNRPEAYTTDSLAIHFEENYAREQQRKLEEQLKKNKHPFARNQMLKANYYALLLAVAKKVSAKEALIEMGISPDAANKEVNANA